MNSVASGGSSSSLFGGVFAASSAVRHAFTGSQKTLWTSDTCLLSFSPSGTGGNLTMFATSSILWGSLSESFTYDSPVSTISPSNIPVMTQQGLRSSIFGKDFGTYSVCGASGAGSTVSESTLWLSDSVLQSRIAVGVGSTKLVSVSIGRLVDSLSQAMSFDSPQITSIRNLAENSTILAESINAGSYDSSTKMRIGHTSCRFTRWVSDSSVLCGLPSELPVKMMVVITASQQLGTFIAFTS
eukprot:140361-Hanusia_phi.AAC.6